MTEPRTTPLEAFDSRLMRMLLDGALSRQEWFADPEKRPPELRPKGSRLDEDERSRSKTTRWSVLIFPTRGGAEKFTRLMKLAHRLHALRKLMHNAGHPDTSKVYRAKVAIEEKIGALVISPQDEEFADILGSVESPVSAPSLRRDPLDDI